MNINFQVRAITSIIIFWMVIHIFLFSFFGIVTDGEAIKYISEANNLLRNEGLSSPNFRMYITQILLIMISLKLHVGYEFVVGVQLLFSLLATLSIFRLGTHLSNSKVGLLAAIWFLCVVPVHQFNTFLQTDSLFYSFTIIYSCYLLRIKTLSVNVMIRLLLGLIVISITRPTGLFFFPATFLYLLFKFFSGFKLSHKVIFLAFISAIFLYFLNAALGSGGELDFMLPARGESIICGVATLPDFVMINESKNANSLYGLLYYVTHNFSQFVRLAFYRSIAFFGVVRPYYSAMHNFYLLLLVLPMYLMIILSLKNWIRHHRVILLYFFILIFFTWVTVILSCDDWHNRFFLAISPYLIILSLPALKRLVYKNVPN